MLQSQIWDLNHKRYKSIFIYPKSYFSQKRFNLNTIIFNTEINSLLKISSYVTILKINYYKVTFLKADLDSFQMFSFICSFVFHHAEILAFLVICSQLIQSGFLICFNQNDLDGWRGEVACLLAAVSILTQELLRLLFHNSVPKSFKKILLI